MKENNFEIPIAILEAHLKYNRNLPDDDINQVESAIKILNQAAK